jgi:hypothetical protein
MAVNASNVAHILLRRAGVCSLRDVDQSVAVAGRLAQQREVAPRGDGIEDQSLRQARIGRRREAADPGEGVEVSQPNVERLAAARGESGVGAVAAVG